MYVVNRILTNPSDSLSKDKAGASKYSTATSSNIKLVWESMAGFVDCMSSILLVRINNNYYKLSVSRFIVSEIK